MSQAACIQASAILNFTYFCLSYTQLEEAVIWVEEMCKTAIPMVNKTHVGPNENATVNI